MLSHTPHGTPPHTLRLQVYSHALAHPPWDPTPHSAFAGLLACSRTPPMGPHPTLCVCRSTRMVSHTPHGTPPHTLRLQVYSHGLAHPPWDPTPHSAFAGLLAWSRTPPMGPHP